MALDGRTICLTFYPQDYLKLREEKWLKHPDLNSIKYLQCQTTKLKEREREFKTERKNLNRVDNLKLTDGGDEQNSNNDSDSEDNQSNSNESIFDSNDTESELNSEIDI